ncbi:Hypothetical predicted protein, partial [Marmota monax]
SENPPKTHSSASSYLQECRVAARSSRTRDTQLSGRQPDYDRARGSSGSMRVRA